MLVAEDDPELRALIAALLARDGFVVSEARDGRELMEIVRAAAREEGAAPSLIVSDVRMPGATGLEALAELRELLVGTAIIVVTAFSDVATRVAARRLGAVDVLSKPFDLEELRASARCAVERRAGQVGP